MDKGLHKLLYKDMTIEQARKLIETAELEAAAANRKLNHARELYDGLMQAEYKRFTDLMKRTPVEPLTEKFAS